MKHVLFVCTANICRSPVAEYYMRHVVERLGWGGRFGITSAGVMGLEGRSADPVASRILARRGVDMSGHQSRGVVPGEAARADQIIVMERRHRAWFKEHMPEMLPRVSLMREQLDGSLDLFDPTGESIDRYQQCLDVLCQSIEKLAISMRYSS